MNPSGPRLYVALPVLDELKNLPVCLSCFSQQRYRNFELRVCVNQPDQWWEDPALTSRCRRNLDSLELLRQEPGFAVQVEDRASPGRGFNGRGGGVGVARRLLMDGIAVDGSPGDVIVSMDADTVIGSGYLASLAQTFRQYPDAAGVTVPYHHPLTGRFTQDRAMLRYEIFLRYHSINLWRIGSPFAFTGLGSGFAVRIEAYRAVGGMPARAAGEDFYLLQKICKHGRLLTWNPDRVYPSARASDRVPFGTGPSVARGMEGDYGAGPLYPHPWFDAVAATCARFTTLYTDDVETPMDSFLKTQLGTDDVWGPLRDNYRDKRQFVRACHGRLDGLRILQYLKARWAREPASPGKVLRGFLAAHHGSRVERWARKGGAFARVARAVEHGPPERLLPEDDVMVLDAVRRMLRVIEEGYRCEQARTWHEAPLKVGTC